MNIPISFVMRILLGVFFLLPPLTGNAQEKSEKESRLNPAEVPALAMEFMESLELPVKVRWYLEEGLSTRSVESKFKYKKARYSVEFDTLGMIEDVEVEVKPNTLPPAVMEAVANQLQKDCSQYKINKIQVQYLGDEEALKNIILSSKVDEDLTTNFELVVRCTQDKEVDLYEYLFDASGAVLSVSKIVFKNSSHLEY